MTIDYSTLTPEQLANMSDEDFAKIDPSQFPTEDSTPADVNEPTGEEDTQVPNEEQQEQVDDSTEDTPEDTPDADDSNEPSSNGNVSEANTSHEEQQANAEEEAEPENKEEDTPKVELTPEQQFYQKVTSEFKANGKQFKIDNPDDVVSLMQKGLHYNQKMAAMKPGMKILKALQDRGIETVEDLGFLLDLQEKNPEAIAKLIQDSGVDAYELNEDKAKTYQPSVPQVSDELINFEMVAKGLESNPNFGTVVQNLQGYDDVTKQEIFKNPQLLQVLTDHVDNGFYDQICARLQQEQAVGRLVGVPFLQAYDQVGNMLFGQQQQQPTPNVVQQPVNNTVSQPKPAPVPVAQKPKPSNNAARQAAAATPSSATQVQKYSYTPEDIWSMSPEEFAKIDPKFL